MFVLKIFQVFPKRITTILFFLLLTFFSVQVEGQVGLSEGKETYIQDFNSLSSTGTSNVFSNNTTLPGWSVSKELITASLTYSADNGSQTAGTLYSYGTESGDRALGSIASNTSGSISYSLKIINKGVSPVTSLKVSYKGEQWRNGGNINAQILSFTYFTCTSFISFNDLNFQSLINTSYPSALNGNLDVNSKVLSASINNLDIKPDSSIILRWTDENDAYSDHGLGIDDLTIEAVFGQTLTIIGTPLKLKSAVNKESKPDSYFLTGSFLNTSVQINTGSDHFKISTSETGPFLKSLSVPAELINNDTTEIFVIYTPDAAGADSISISHIAGSLKKTFTVTGKTLVFFTIPQIQGDSTASPYLNAEVQTSGVVTKVLNRPGQFNGFHIQDFKGDRNEKTSDGIYIVSTVSVMEGDSVVVSGIVKENSMLTQLTSTTVAVAGKQKPMKYTPVKFPSHPTLRFEPYESMLVSTGKMTVIDNKNLGTSGELVLSAAGRMYAPTNSIDPNNALRSGTTYSGKGNVTAINNYLSSCKQNILMLDDNSDIKNISPVPYLDRLTKTLRIGSEITNIKGVLEYRFSSYRIQPDNKPAITYAPRPEDPENHASCNLKCACFNLDNFSNPSAIGMEDLPASKGANSISEYKKQMAKIIKTIIAMDADIVGLSGVKNDGGNESSTLGVLVKALNDSIGKPGYYRFVANRPADNLNVDELKVAILYKNATVIPDSQSDSPDDLVFKRPPLAQMFLTADRKESFFFVVADLHSRECDYATENYADQKDGQGCYNYLRVEQANRLDVFIRSLETRTNVSRFILMGNLDSYLEEDPLDLLRSRGYIIMENSYSYNKEGQSGQLDHAVITSALEQNVQESYSWNINSDEPSILDYNEENDQQLLNLYKADPYRSSSHDPVIITLNIPGIITASNSHGNKAGFTVFPNPVNDGIIRFSEEVSGEITDLSGKLLMKLEAANQADISALPPGVYLLKTESGECISFMNY